MSPSVRAAVPGDCQRFWEWANDPVVREASFSQATIPWDEHVRWFTARIAEGAPMFVVEDASHAAIGQVRFDRQADGTFTVGVSLDASVRGRGLAAPSLAAAAAALRRTYPHATIAAYVRSENAASMAAFVRAGFAEMGAVRMHGCDAVRLVSHA